MARYFGHFEGDTQTYRGPDEVKKVREGATVSQRSRACCGSPDAADSSELEGIERHVIAEVDDAIAYARTAACPEASDLLTDVYISY